MAHKVGRRAVQRGDIEGVANDGDIQVRSNHQAERSATDDMRLAECSEHAVEREVGTHRRRLCGELLRS